MNTCDFLYPISSVTTTALNHRIFLLTKIGKSNSYSSNCQVSVILYGVKQSMDGYVLADSASDISL